MERNPIPADRIPAPYPNEAAARNANNNALPPDLSLIAKARHGGAHYVYSLLTGYRDAATYRNHDGEALPADNRPGAVCTSIPGSRTSTSPWPRRFATTWSPMRDGTSATVDQMAQDVSAFLAWTAEPESDSRKNNGLATLIFLLFGTVPVLPGLSERPGAHEALSLRTGQETKGGLSAALFFWPQSAGRRWISTIEVKVAPARHPGW